LRQNLRQSFLILSFLITSSTFLSADVLLGDQNIESNTDSYPAGHAQAFQITATATGTLSSLSLYVDPLSMASQGVMGLYSDNGGQPSTLLTQVTFSPQAGTWNTYNVPAVQVVAGTSYWIAVLGLGSGRLYYRDIGNLYYRIGITCNSVGSGPNLTSLPATWYTQWTYGMCLLSAYGSGLLVSVSVVPNSPSLLTGGTQQFTANVSATTNTAVTWSAGAGTISSSGLYIAPTTPGTYAVTATSVADTTKSASTMVAVTAPVMISVMPTVASLQTGGTQQFFATVTGTGNTAVTWSTTAGSISSTGLYTAPNTAGSYTVTATSAADPTKSASATVTVTAPVVISVSPTVASLPTGGTQQFTAMVTGTTNTGVTWAAQGGSVSSAGLYTAPTSSGTYIVTATSIADSTKTASATVTAVPVTSGLVAAYAFNEGTGTTVYDASINGNNGTISGATWTTSGRYGSALVFNGNSSVVTVPDSPSLHLSSGMTLEAWVNPSTTQGWMDVVYKGMDIFFLEGSSPGGQPGTGLTLSNGGLPLVYSTSVLPLGTWTHLAATFDGTTLRLYVNGTQVGSQPWSGTIGGSTSPLTIGGDAVFGQYFAGTVDEIRVYNVPLSQSQIQTDMATPIGGSASSSTTVAVGVSPATATVTAGGSQQFTASVTGSTNTNVMWSATAGAVSSSGLYTAPATPGTYTVTATSAADPTKSASATVTVTAPVAVSVTPLSTSLATGGTQQFTATVTGTNNAGVTWSATGGTVSSTGLYTAPAAGGSYTVTATSNADPTKSGSAGVTVSAPLTSGLVAAYAFNEGAGTTVSDASGNANNGTISGATWTTSGRYGSALVFNGSSSIVTIPDSPSLHLSSGMTLEAWINASTTRGWMDVVYKGMDIFFLEGSSPGGQPGTGLTLSNGGLPLVYSTSVLPLGTWTHLAATFDGTTLRLYVNGTQVGSQPWSGTIGGSTSPLTIGGDAVFGQYFAGTVDEIRVYNVPLSQSQIQTDMATPIGGSASSSTTVAIGVSPATATVSAGGSQQFTASVTGSTNTNVTWSATGGAVSSSGLYTAPTTAGTYTVTATSAADPTKSGSATVTVAVTGTVTVSISPSSTSLLTGGSQQFTATVTGTSNTAVLWKATGGVVSSTGLYTAPAAAGSYTVTATSAADSTKSASALVGVSAPIQHSVSLNWIASTSAVAGYDVYRATQSGGPYTMINSALQPGTSYVDLSVQAGNTYYYVVTCVNSSGVESAYSNQATAVVPSP
jgi:hypothetical protein